MIFKVVIRGSGGSIFSFLCSVLSVCYCCIGHCVVCPSVLFVLAIVLSVLLFFLYWLLCCLSFCSFCIGHCVCLLFCSFCIGHCVVCPSFRFILAIVLPVLFFLYWPLRCLYFCYFCIGHCFVCLSSISRFWLPHWYRQSSLIVFIVYYCIFL